MQTEQEQRNDKRTPAAELTPELRNRLLCAMLDLQSVIQGNIKLRHELATRLQPQPPSGDVIARLKLGVLAEVQRQRQNEHAMRSWRRGLAVAGAVCAIVVLLLAALVVLLTAPAPIDEDSNLVTLAPVSSSPYPQTNAVAQVTRIYAFQPLKQKCECPNELHQPDCSVGLMCEDSLRCEGSDGSVLMIRVPNVVEFNMDKDVI